MKGRAAGRVRSGQTFCRQSRVGSGRVNVSPGRVQEKWPVDNVMLVPLPQLLQHGLMNEVMNWYFIAV